ncbi:hypothetical protein ACFW1P_06165 [Paenibacillus sp. NPDC058910]|uniref:hypothetical protein n=1 Tax=unclassified Paenibacillus TaxID=185978 RepID=UPI0036C8D042
MKLNEGQRLVMIGDSITDCERKYPYGEGLFQGVGKGYAALVDGMLEAISFDWSRMRMGS